MGRHPKYLVVYGNGDPHIDGCPCPYEVAAQHHMMLRQMHRAPLSIYRGSDPEAVRILHARGKHTQPELYEISIHGTPAQRIAVGLPPGGGGVNKPGESQHDLHSDGVANTQPPGHPIPAWSVGDDTGDNSEAERNRVHAAGRHYGWYVKTPYRSAGERHHWCFGAYPKARNPWQAVRIAYWRRRLPRR